jgi:alkanesulfonate monooxygenase SsuD/methylene tetrahydromethanopterin reductase-like flavin-dependent oxidoreductase (luciferase family)
LAVGDLCERTQIDSLWFSDRLLAPALEPLAALAAVAARTRRLKFGTAVLVLPFRSPLLAAKTLATLDVLPRDRADEATLRAVTAVGPAEAVAAAIERYVRGGGTKFVLRPLAPPEAALDQVAELAEAVVPAFHAR